MELNRANGSRRGVEEEIDKERCKWQDNEVCHMTGGSLSALANQARAPLLLLHVAHGAFKGTQRSRRVSSQRSYPSAKKKGSARQAGRRLYRPRQANRGHRQEEND